MKKIIVTAFIILSASLSILAQDLIIKKNGEEIKGKVKLISSTDVEYARTENPDGPSYKVAKADILMIMYANGTKDIFNVETNPTNTEAPKVKQGRTTVFTGTRPAQRYYNYDFFDRKVPLVFLGIDFSYAKLNGPDFENPKGLFGDLNGLLTQEKTKYDVNGAVRKGDLPYQFGIVDKRNQSIDEKSVIENITDVITFADLQNIVDEYDMSTLGLTDGLAMVIICENMSRPRADAAYYYVVFDVASKKVVISDRLIGRAGGSGLRNYWAKSIYNTIVMLRDRKYAQWKMMFRR